MTTESLLMITKYDDVVELPLSDGVVVVVEPHRCRVVWLKNLSTSDSALGARGKQPETRGNSLH